MADNANYDQSMAGLETPQLAEVRDAVNREATLNSQGTMIAPAPLQMTPEEKVLSLEKQNGTYNPGGDVEMAANMAEGQLAAQAYPQTADTVNGEQSLASTLNPNTDFLDAQQAQQQRVVEQKKLDMIAPLYSKMKAQDDLKNAAQTLEGTRQANLDEKATVEQTAVKEHADFKNKYDGKVATKLMELDNQLKQVEEDALASRQSTSDLFQNKSSGAKMAAGIAMILGAGGEVMKGNGRNVGIEVVQSVLENERKQLISNFANSKELLALKSKNLDDYNDAVMKQMAVADKQKMLQLQVLNTKLGIAESRYRGTAAGASALDAKANIQMTIDQMKAQQANQDAINSLMGSGASVDDMPLAVAAQMTGQKPGEIYKNRQERAVALPGMKKPIYATDPTSAGKAREIIGPSEIIQENLAHIAKIVRENPAAVKVGGLTKAGTEAQAAMGRITAAMKGMEALGALDNGVVALVDGIVSNPSKLINQANYAQIANDLKQGANKRLESYGVRGYAVPKANYSFKTVAPGMVDAKYSKFLKSK